MNACKIIISFLSLLLCGCASQFPKDRDVQSAYFLQKPMFQKIVGMLKDDGALEKIESNSPPKRPSFVQDVSIINLSDTNLIWGILKVSDSRKAEYKKAFDKINIGAAYIYKDVGRVEFIIKSTGFGSSTTYKGIAYFPNPADYPQYTIVHSTDNQETNTSLLAVPIEANWYIYRDPAD